MSTATSPTAPSRLTVTRLAARSTLKSECATNEDWFSSWVRTTTLPAPPALRVSVKARLASPSGRVNRSLDSPSNTRVAPSAASRSSSGVITTAAASSSTTSTTSERIGRLS